MKQVSLCILWHMHQPYYRDDVSGECSLPWVRLHAIKDYFGMAALASRFPKVKLTFNFVPSLLEQLRSYADGRTRDVFQELSAKPVGELTEDDRQALLESFFLANRSTMISPYPRYDELFRKRQNARQKGRYGTRRFSPQELLDLQVWFNLCWFHPLARERWPELGSLIDKGQGFTQVEKLRVLELQQEVMAAVAPLYRKLEENGQLELTTSPYFHPILPLLVDRSSARIAMPQARIPGAGRSYGEDARRQLRSASQAHEEAFGRPPRGLWPSEGSVSRDIVPLCREAGFSWLATDEDILALSLGQTLDRDANRHLLQPDLLYQPYLYQGSGGPITVLFRDHCLSDLIGFQYQKAPAQVAVADLLDRIRHSAQRCRLQRSPLIAIILDGENAWEHYPQQGLEFLSLLYEKLSSAEDLVTVTPSEYLESQPPTATLETLFPGSWINHNFAIWIGHDEDNRAWSYLDRTRDFLLAKADGSDQPRSAEAERAWRELYIAEGSDWFWWFGDDHFSGMDDQYDRLFRRHLKNVYLLLGDEPPVYLETPITQLRTKPVYTTPTQFLEVRVDGRHGNYFEWLGAGRYHTSPSRGAMAASTRGSVKELYYGFNEREFLLRIDCYRKAREVLGSFSAIRVLVGDDGWEVVLELTACGSEQPTVRVSRAGGEAEPVTGARAACDVIFELAVPLAGLGLSPGREAGFVVELVGAEGVAGRFPRESAIRFRVPTPDFEERMWTA